MDTHIYNNTLADCYIWVRNGGYVEEVTGSEDIEHQLPIKDLQIYNNIIQNRWEEYHRGHLNHRDWGIKFDDRDGICPMMTEFSSNNNLYQGGVSAAPDIRFRHWDSSGEMDENSLCNGTFLFDYWQALVGCDLSEALGVGEGYPWILSKGANHEMEHLNGYRLNSSEDIRQIAEDRAKGDLFVRDKGTEPRVPLDWAFRGEEVIGPRNIGAFEKFGLRTRLSGPFAAGSKLTVRGLSPGSCGAIALSGIPIRVYTSFKPLRSAAGGGGQVRFSDVQMVSVEPYDRNIDVLLTFEGK